jgi:hypothetical protein
VIFTLAPAAILSAPPILFTRMAGIASLYGRRLFHPLFQQKSAQKETSPATGIAYYITAIRRGQAFFP